MDIEKLKFIYEQKKRGIKTRLGEFKALSEKNKEKEFFFCLLTPQSNALRCWDAVEQIFNSGNFTDDKIREILKTRTRFHNNKTKYILEGKIMWNKIRLLLASQDSVELRNWLADNVKGYGLKEASHFLRNIGKSSNQIAILDRHILKNLKEQKVIKEAKIKNKKDYLEKEQAYLRFSEEIKIPADELDLLWWSEENGIIFK